MVEQHFPPLTFDQDKGDVRFTLDYRGLTSSDNRTEVLFEDVSAVKLEERNFKRYLEVLRSNTSTATICLSRLPAKGQPFVAAFEQYYGRHLAARRQATALSASAATA